MPEGGNPDAAMGIRRSGPGRVAPARLQKWGQVVHLGDPAIAVLRGVEREDDNPWVITSPKQGEPLSDVYDQCPATPAVAFWSGKAIQ